MSSNTDTNHLQNSPKKNSLRSFKGNLHAVEEEPMPAVVENNKV